jgi:hypothetical protein
MSTEQFIVDIGYATEFETIKTVTMLNLEKKK